jgi:hypothetical protein
MNRDDMDFGGLARDIDRRRAQMPPVDPLYGPLGNAQSSSSGNIGSPPPPPPPPPTAQAQAQGHIGPRAAQYFICVIPTAHGINEFYGPFASAANAFAFAGRYYGSQPIGIFPEQHATVVMLEDPSNYP